MERHYVEVVLQNELLLDHILRYAIYDDKTLLINVANTCKLVRRQWMNRVTALTHKTRGTNQYQVDVCCTGLKTKECDRDVESFIATFQDTPPDRIPSYQVHFAASGKNISKEMLLSVGMCLSRFGTGLVSLIVELPFGLFDANVEPIEMPSLETPLQVPYLKSLDIYLSTTENHAEGSLELYATPFIREILLGCKRLKTFFMWGTPDILQMPPFECKVLELPQTITEVVLDCCLESGRMESLLLRQPLTNLLSLTFRLPNSDISSEISNILKQFCTQLETLIIYGQEGVESSELRTTICLPVMKKLKKLYISAENYDVMENPFSDFATAFPALQKMTFRDQANDMLRKWIEHSKFYSVNSLNLDLDDTTDENYGDQRLFFNQMDCLKRAFPNVTILNISIVFSSNLSSIRFIFQHIKNLRYLGIDVYGCAADVSSNVFNSLLIGITPEQVAALEANTNVADDIVIKYGELTSLVNMKDLEKLRLSCRCGGSLRLISDVAFDYAFLKMPKLMELALWYRFQASVENAKKWIAHGRILRTCSNVETC